MGGRMNNLVGKKGQMAIFVIVAILVVTGIVAYFAFRGGFEIGGIPEELQPVYSYYLECIEDETESALNLAGNQGGRIDTGEYIPGSEYAPFSNQLNFLGFPVPYWYYISGNGLIDTSGDFVVTTARGGGGGRIALTAGDNINFLGVHRRKKTRNDKRFGRAGSEINRANKSEDNGRNKK